MCLPAASVLPIANNENFGTFSFHGQLSDKRGDIPLGQCTAFGNDAPAV
jgi:hypothetical protein